MTNNNFLVDSESYEKFNNISRFVSNSIIKNTTNLDEGETTSSKYLDSFLKRYYDNGLTGAETAKLYNFIMAYNTAITAKLSNSYFSSVLEFSYDMSDTSFYNTYLKKYYGKIDTLIAAFVADTGISQDLSSLSRGDITTIYMSATKKAAYTTISKYYTLMKNSKQFELLSLMKLTNYITKLGVNSVGLDYTVEISKKSYSKKVLTSDGWYYGQADASGTKDTTAVVTAIRDYLGSNSDNSIDVGNKLIYATFNIKNLDSGDAIYSIDVPILEYAVNTTDYSYYIVTNYFSSDDEGTTIDSTTLNSAISIFDDNDDIKPMINSSTVVFPNSVDDTNIKRYITDNIDKFFKYLCYSDDVIAVPSISNFLTTSTGSLTIFNGIDNTLTNGAATVDFELFSYINYEKFRFQIYISTTENGYTKNSASSQEVSWANDKEPVTFFDLKDIDVTDCGLADNITYSNSSSETATAKTLFSVVIFFKDLNPNYRTTMNSDIYDRILTNILYIYEVNSDDNNIITLGSNTLFTSLQDLTITDDIQNIYRSYSDGTGYIIHTDTTEILYPYFYSNAYQAHRADESEIIGYYAGDYYISNGYGVDTIDKLEIANFLSIYKTTRDYYYMVLLNEAFVNDSEYKTYEKFFICFWSIERFISSKIDNIHDIDYFDSTDVHNFLVSYGLNALDESEVFYDQLDMNKQVLQYFNELVKSKGSKGVIDKLITVFDFEDTEIDIKKFMLADVTDLETDSKNNLYYKITDDVTDLNDVSSLKFLEIPYTSDNETRELNSALSNNSYGYESFIADDEDWTIDNVPEVELRENTGIDIAETKYLSLSLRDNIYKDYILSRYALSTIDSLYTRTVSTTNNMLNAISILDENISTTDIDVITYFNIIRTLYEELNYAYSKRTTFGSTGSVFYGIPTVAELGTTKSGKIKDFIDGLKDIDSSIDIDSLFTDTKYLNGVRTEFTKVSLYTKYDNTVYHYNNGTKYYISQDTGTLTTAANKLCNYLFSETKVKTTSLNPSTFVASTLNNINAIILDKADLFDIIYNHADDDDLTYNDLSTSDSSFYTYLVAPIMEFPVEYFNGMINPANTAYKYGNSYDFEKFIELVFSTFYTTSVSSVDKKFVDTTNEVIYISDIVAETSTVYGKSDDILSYIDYMSTITDITSTSSDTDFDTFVAAISTKLISCITTVQSVFATEDFMQFSLSLDTNSSNELAYLKAAIEIFLSYTTTLYEAVYKKVYNTTSESCPLSEKVRYTYNTTKADSLYYDEKFKVDKTYN